MRKRKQGWMVMLSAFIGVYRRLKGSSGNIEDHVTDLVSGFYRFVRRRDFGQWKAGCDGVFRPPPGNPAGDIGNGLPLGRVGHGVDEDHAHGHVALPQPRRQHAVLRRRRGVCRDHGRWPQGLFVRRQVDPELDIDYAVYALPGQVREPRGDVLGAVVDSAVRAALARVLRLFRRADRGDHARAGPARELDRVMPHHPRTPRHQHGHPVDRTVGKETAVRRHDRDAEAGALGEGDLARQGNDLRRRQADVLRGGPAGTLPLAVVDPHALAQPRLRYSGADAVDLAGAVAVGDDPRWYYRPAAAARLDVGGVDRGRVQPDAHLALAGQRIGLLADLQHPPRGAVFFVPAGKHWGAGRWGGGEGGRAED